MNEKELAEKYVIERGFKKAKGFSINPEEMNPTDCDEVFFEGETLEEAIDGYYKVIEEYWIYEPSDGEQIFEDVFDAVDYVEDNSDISFEDYKKKHYALNKNGGKGK